MADNPKIKKISIANQEYDIEPANSEVLAAEHIIDALGYTPADEADLANKVDTSTEVNGKALSSDITLYGSDITADSATATALIDTATHKIPESLLPDSVLGQMIFGGSVEKSAETATLDYIIAYPTVTLKGKLNITDDSIRLINAATDDKTKSPKEFGYKTLERVYFLVRNEFDITVGSETVHFDVGDWLIGAGSYWDKIDNVDAVKGVKGDKEESYRTGNINLTADNIGALNALSSSTDNAIVRFDGTGGNLVQISGASIDDDGNLFVGRIVGGTEPDSSLSLINGDNHDGGIIINADSEIIVEGTLINSNNSEKYVLESRLPKVKRYI